MVRGRPRFSIVVCCSLIALVWTATSAFGKIPTGFRDVKLGMHKSQVLEVLEKNRAHFSHDDVRNEIRQVVRDDELFRYATYLFSPDGLLVEIDLKMREILGRDRVLELYSAQHGIKVTPVQAATEASTKIEVRDNTLVVKTVKGQPARSAKRP